MANQIGQTKIYYPGNRDTEKRQKELDRKNLVYAVLGKLEDTMKENKLDDIQKLLKTVKSKDLEKFLKGK